MTQLDRLKASLPSNMHLSDTVLQAKLDSARDAIMGARYPASPWPVDENEDPVLERQYLSLQIDIATELCERIGGSTQTAHGENGITRGWENAGISASLLSRVTPVVPIYKR